MNQGTQENQVPSTLINVKRVRTETGKGKNQDQEAVVLTFGLDQEGNNGLDTLIDTLEQYRGKQVNFDIRLTDKTSKTGQSFKSAFVIVKEMIPRGSGGGQTYTKKPGRQEKIKADAAKFKNGIE